MEKHSPLKKKLIRSNQQLLLIKIFRKLYALKLNLKWYWAKPYELAYKSQKIKCVLVTCKSIKKQIIGRRFGNKQIILGIHQTILNYKGMLANFDIALVDGKKIISDDFELAKTYYHNYHINKVEINSRNKPLKIINPLNDEILVIGKI